MTRYHYSLDSEASPRLSVLLSAQRRVFREMFVAVAAIRSLSQFHSNKCLPSCPYFKRCVRPVADKTLKFPFRRSDNI